MNAFQAISASVASSSSAAPTSATVVTGMGYPGGSSWTTEAGGGAGGGVVSGAGSLKEMVGSPLTSTPPASTHSMFAPVVGSGSKSSSSSSSANVDRDQVFQWIQELTSPSTREHALIELSRKREVLPDLAPMLWHSFGTMAALLQEIVMIYPVINPPNLTAQQSNRVCNALALLQCVASHPETRTAFLNAHIPLFLYPFLHTVSKSRPFEYLRLTSLGVVGALVKTDEQDVINFLLTTEIIPLCLRIMESGSELSKTVATFILQKILLDETGLSYICQTFERFSHVSTVLSKMVQTLSKEPSSRLLKHVVRCYLRLSDNPRAREALRQCLPVQLKDSTFSSVLKEDGTTKKWLLQLLSSLGLELPSIVTATANTSISSSSSSTTAASIAVVTAAENGRPSATTLHSSSPSSNLQQSQ